MPTKSEFFVQEFVLGFGFLGGLFAYVGVDPEEEVMRSLLAIAIPNNASLLSLVAILLGIVGTFTGIAGAYAAAGKGGLIVVAVAWIAGVTISAGSTLTTIGAFLLVGALVTGPIVYNYHNS
jgi:hypothetical protein